MSRYWKPGQDPDMHEDMDDMDDADHEPDELSGEFDPPDPEDEIREDEPEEEDDEFMGFPAERYGGEYEEETDYERNVREYTQREYQYRMCRERLAYLLDEIRRRVPPDQSRWKALEYHMPTVKLSSPGTGAEKLLAGGKLDCHELRPWFYPPTFWKHQAEGYPGKVSHHETDISEGGDEWKPEAGEKPDDRAVENFCYQKTGPDIDPAAGPALEQWWHWALNVVVDEVPWVVSRETIRDMWKVKWAERYPNIYHIMAEYAGWKTTENHEDDRNHEDERM